MSCNFSLSTMVDYADWTGSTIYFWFTGPVDKKTSRSMLRTLYQDFKVSTDVPWLHWPIQVDFWCFWSSFECGIWGFYFYLFLILFYMFFFGTGWVVKCFFHSKIGCISWIPSAYFSTESWPIRLLWKIEDFFQSFWFPIHIPIYIIYIYMIYSKSNQTFDCNPTLSRDVWNPKKVIYRINDYKRLLN